MQINSNNNSEITDRISFFIEEMGITKYKFHKDLGFSNGFLDKSRSIGTDKYEKILAYLEKYKVNPKWLLSGIGEKTLTNRQDLNMVNEPEAIYSSSPKNKGKPMVPLDAIAGVSAADIKFNERDIKDYYLIPDFKDADFYIKVRGSSMYPKYYPGDILACRRSNKDNFIQWNKPYVINSSEGVMVKRIIKGPDHWILRSDNNEYQDIEVNPDNDIYSISIIIGSIRFE